MNALCRWFLRTGVRFSPPPPLILFISMPYEIRGGPSPRSGPFVTSTQVEAARQAACSSLNAMPTETLVLIDTFVQWIRRRAPANLAWSSHSL
jgi:hypothetical protein